MRSRLSVPLNDAEQSLLENTYRRYRDAMYSAAFSYLHNEADAEDIVQEVFVRLAQRHMSTVTRLSQDDSLLYYLLTAVRNAAMSHFRKANVRKELPVDMDESGLSLPADEIFIDQLNASLDGSDLAGTIDAMEPIYRDVLYQRFILGLSTKEIADISRLPLSTVKKRLLRAKKLLWKQYKEECR